MANGAVTTPKIAPGAVSITTTIVEGQVANVPPQQGSGFLIAQCPSGSVVTGGGVSETQTTRLIISQQTANKLNVSSSAIISGAVLISGSYNTQMPPCQIIIKIPRQELESAVSYWTEIIGAHIIEYDSIRKETFHKQWSTEDDTTFDTDYYMGNLRKEVYDKGFAVRTGRLNRGPDKGYYLISIDFDTLEAFLAWCGDDYNLDTLAKWTRVDWHKDRAKVHVFFISKTPLKDLARSNNNQIIEIYGKKPHLVCVYGNHKDGNPMGPYDTEEIAAIDNITKLEIESRIKQVIPSYLDDRIIHCG